MRSAAKNIQATAERLDAMGSAELRRANAYASYWRAVSVLVWWVTVWAFVPIAAAGIRLAQAIWWGYWP